MEVYGPIAFLSFLDPQTGTVDRQPFPVDEIEARFEVLDAGTAAFQGNPEAVRLVAEAVRLSSRRSLPPPARLPLQPRICHRNLAD